MLNMQFERKKAKLTQQQLGDKVGVQKYAINKYETERINPSLPVLRKISEVLGVSIDDLVRRV